MAIFSNKDVEQVSIKGYFIILVPFLLRKAIVNELQKQIGHYRGRLL